MKAKSSARAIADLHGGTILATVDIATPPERVFRALTTDEVIEWWGSDATYRTTSWRADVRVGGTWRASGVGNDGAAFEVHGEYTTVDPPRRLEQTWEAAWDPGASTRLAYMLEPIPGGTRLTLRHEGFAGRAATCSAQTSGWEHVLGWLDAYLGGEREAPAKHFVVKLIPPRPRS
jgi:uncharacterized protein YndB with AHSA1/START domain